MGNLYPSLLTPLVHAPDKQRGEEGRNKVSGEGKKEGGGKSKEKGKPDLLARFRSLSDALRRRRLHPPD